MALPPNVDDKMVMRFKGKADIAKTLHMSIAEFTTWYEGELFGEIAEDLYRNVLLPRQEAADLTNTPIKKTMTLNIVMGAIREGEQAGRRRYTARKPAKETFAMTDWYAYTLLTIISENNHSFNGIFYNKPTMPDSDKYILIWAVLMFWSWDHSKSRRMKRAQGAERRKRKAIEKAALDRPKRPRLSPETLGNASSAEVDAAVTGEEEEEEDDASDGDASPTSEERVISEMFFPEAVVAPVSAETEQELTNLIEDRNFRAQLMEPTITNDGSVQTLLSPMQAMKLERSSELEPNLTDRYWIYDKIQRITKAPNVETIQVQEELLANVHSIEDMTWQRSITEDDDGGKLPFTLATEDDKQKFLKNQELLDNPRLQPDDHETACRELGMLSSDNPRLPGMPVTARFKFWQPVAMYNIMLSLIAGISGHCLFDAMGLGKTWIVIGFLVAMNYKFEETIRQARSQADTRPFRPTLILVPKSLLNQWETELLKVCNRFRVMRYYGDWRSGENSFDAVLTRDHPIFRNEPANIWTIILSTPATIAKRHGPGLLAEHRQRNLNWTSARAHNSYMVPDHDWERSLHGLFEYCVVDEATSIKNISSQAHIAVSWLMAGFHILMTGTPDINSAEDITGYIPFLQSRLPQLWDTDYMQSLGFDSSMNPYTDLEDKSLAAKMYRPTTKFFTKYIAQLQDPAIIGQYQASLFATCGTRRTYASVLNGKQIISEMPILKTQTAMCSFDEAGQAKYSEYSKIHIKHLMRVDQFSGKLTWNWAHFRMLTLLCTWLGFKFIGDRLTANKVQDMYKSENLLQHIVKWYTDASPEEVFPTTSPARIKLVLRDSPKLAALLRIIGDVVVLGKRKLIIFCTLPAQQCLAFALLQALNINAEVYHAGLDQKARTSLQDRFNNDASPMVLIGSFATMACGLNLQKRCAFGIFLEPPPSLPWGFQAIARIYRIGQEEIVYLVVLSVHQTFNERISMNNIRKALPGIVANLNTDLFNPSLVTSDDDEVTLEVGEWAVVNGLLVPVSDPTVQPHHKRVTGMDVVTQILNHRIGEQFDWPTDEQF